MINSIDFFLIIPELFLVILLNCVILFGIMNSKSVDLSFENSKNNNNNKHIVFVAMLPTPVLIIESVIYIVILLIIFTLILLINSFSKYAIIFNNSILIDNLSLIASSLILIGSMIVLNFSNENFKKNSIYEFVLILTCAIIGMIGITKSYNFLIFYIFIELQSFSSFILAAIKTKNEHSVEASLKYFILGALSSIILLLGITLIYYSTGSMSFESLGLILNSVTSLNFYSNELLILNIGLLSVLIGLLFKLGAAPFHYWVADVYEGSLTSITAFFALISKISILVALIRIIELIANNDFKFIVYFLTGVSALSLIIGTLSAMRQIKLKRLMAFSSIANAGWFLAALSTGNYNFLLVHLIVYIFINCIFFALIINQCNRNYKNLNFISKTQNNLYLKNTNTNVVIDHGSNSNTIKYISDLNELYKTNQLAGIYFSLAMFNLAGIPPLAGFYSKYLIINNIVNSEHLILLIIAILSAILSSFYYIRIIKNIYFVDLINKKSINKIFNISIKSNNAYVVTIFSIISLLFILNPSYLILLLE